MIFRLLIPEFSLVPIPHSLSYNPCPTGAAIVAHLCWAIYMGHMDQIALGDPTLSTGGKGLRGYMEESWRICLEKPCGWPQTVMGDRANDLFGPHMNDYRLWARKIKKAFEPNGTSESTHYLSANKKSRDFRNE